MAKGYSRKQIWLVLARDQNPNRWKYLPFSEKIKKVERIFQLYKDLEIEERGNEEVLPGEGLTAVKTCSDLFTSELIRMEDVAHESVLLQKEA